MLARPTNDGFLIPLFFGSGADWVRNVQQAGGCELEWRRTTHRLENPRVVAANSVRDQVRSAFRAPERAMFAVSGINEYVRLDRR